MKSLMLLIWRINGWKKKGKNQKLVGGNIEHFTD